jgi:hypothetical protein
MAAALVRRSGAGLARGRGMCSATAAERAALTSEELMRMERERSAHKYGLPLDLPSSLSCAAISLTGLVPDSLVRGIVLGSRFRLGIPRS